MPNQKRHPAGIRTPTFITEIKLEVNSSQERTLRVRFDVARQLYNACLGEALKRLERVKNSDSYQTAKTLPKFIGSKACPEQGRREDPKPNPERKALFQQAREEQDFSEYSLHAYAKSICDSWLGEHIDSQATQKVATRAFKAVNDYAFGKHGKPRFKGKGQLDSVEGKSNVSGIRWKNGTVHWMGLELKAIIDESDLVLMHGLTSPVKYVRLVRRKFGDQYRFFAQLVCEGVPYRKPQHTVGTATVGLDIGPSTIALVSIPSTGSASSPTSLGQTPIDLIQNAALSLVGELRLRRAQSSRRIMSKGRTADLKTFCDKLERRNKYLRRLQRQMDRSRRATNPDNFNSNGTAKKGRRHWHKSNHYKAVASHKANVERKQAAHRKSLHGQLANQTLKLGRTIKTEKLSYRAFQKMFGRSVGFRAPGAFLSILRRKAANAGGVVYEFDPRPTRLSQTCVCGSIKKKALSQRVHQCECGVVVQRDIFSAYLACHVEQGRLKADSVLRDWSEAENLLRTALRRSASSVEPSKKTCE